MKLVREVWNKEEWDLLERELVISRRDLTTNLYPERILEARDRVRALMLSESRNS